MPETPGVSLQLAATIAHRKASQPTWQLDLVCLLRRVFIGKRPYENAMALAATRAAASSI